MNVGVIGYGYVGSATGEGFASNPDNKVFWFDKFKESPWTLEQVIEKSDFIFICVPTPIFSDYSGMDMSIVEGVVGQIAPKIKGTHKIIIIKSTSLPGTCRKMSEKYPGVNIVMNPEFLTQERAKQDFMKPYRTVIGAGTEDIGRKIVDLYMTILPPDQKYFIVSPTEAELIKFMSNLVLASKVMLGNEFYKFAQKVGANYISVEQAVEGDPRIGSHLGAPGPDGDMGFGGACFPKDTIGLLGVAKKLKVDMPVLKSVWEENLKVRKHRDWESMPQAFEKKK